ncbi:ABC transporter ATP-binding protein [Ureibacillus sp. MALMAid1270]|uniref:ABC transporter ATP-binding protein n=1 Tax=Ureibacillus sp. MALMAid1270 TaxID=3411629 RepID=UPI003BA48CC7
MNIVKVNIKKAGYLENQAIIENIEFEIPNGELVGLIGANGAGKSTTIQAIMNTAPFMEGECEIKTYGYIPERPIIYEYFTLSEHIDFLIRTLNQDEAQLRKRAEELCKVFRLERKLHEYPTNFSKGMQQKVMLILALTPTYDFYILDEPFMGLDPQAIRKLIQIIEDYKNNGAAILMSTHALDTAEKICDQFVLIHNGTVLKKGTLKELQRYKDEPLLDIFDDLIEEAEHEHI